MLPSQVQLSTLLGSLYDAAAEPGLWGQFLQQLGQSTRATAAALVWHEFDHAPSMISSSWQLNPDSIHLYQKHYYALDIWAQRARTKGAGSVVNSECLCPLQEMKTTEIFNDFLVPDNVQHGMFGILEDNKCRGGSISLYRDRKRPEFASRDTRILEFLTPHLQRAFRLHSHLTELRSRAEGVEAALDCLSTGVVLFGACGEASFLNRAALALISKNDGLQMTKIGLRAQRQEESALLEKTIREACSTTSGQRGPVVGTVLISRQTRPALKIVITPVPGSILQSSQSVRAIAFVNDPLQRRCPAQDILRNLFGLTPAECRVALLLGDARSPREISETIGVSFETVRSQIKSIFAKTGVKRQGELIRVLADHTSDETPSYK